MQWKDNTSYTRGEERIPRTWEATHGPVRLVVLQKHRHNPGYWTMHGYGLGIDTLDLGIPDTEPAETAQEAAIGIAAHKARQILNAIMKIGATCDGD